MGSFFNLIAFAIIIAGLPVGSELGGTLVARSAVSSAVIMTIADSGFPGARPTVVHLPKRGRN
jgi:hypothetical protein